MNKSSYIKLHRLDKTLPERIGLMHSYERDMQGHTYSLHRHKFIEIEYMVDGEFDINICGTRLHFEGGDFNCLGLADYHSIEIHKGSSLHQLCINYTALPPILQKLINSQRFPLVGHFTEKERGQISEDFHTVGRLIVTDDTFAEEKLTAHAVLLLCKLFDRANRLEVKNESNGYRHIIKAMDYLLEHYTEAVTLDDVARSVYLSPNYFSKLFSEINGMTFSDYLTRLRIEKAHSELSRTKKSVAAIALECGFSSFSSFSKKFKQICGYTPSELRAMIQEE